MIASAQTIRRLNPLTPLLGRNKFGGMSFGLSPAGYDIRILEHTKLWPQGFKLASSVERFHMPNNLLGIVHDKSTWARMGLTVQNTVIEPGWSGYLTLELTNHSAGEIDIMAGMPIAQIIFHLLDEATEQPYSGKYQNQEQGAQPARLET